MKKIILSLTFFLSFICLAFADNERIISVNELPKAAQEFLSKHYADVAIQYVKVKRSASLLNYEVNLKGGHEVQFNKKGAWIEIRCKQNPIPEGIIPTKITDYVGKYYPTRHIEKIEYNARIYEVDLDNGVEIIFNKSLKAVDIND